MYNHFTQRYSTCALRFTYNHVKQPDSRKVNAPYWTGRAVCRTGSCIAVEFTIEHQPADAEDVTVNVSVTGQCAHLKKTDEAEEIDVDMPNRRQLSGQQRQDTATQIHTTTTSATELHYKKLSEMTDDEIRAGNETRCQTPTVFRQAAYERRMAERLHPNAVTELDIARECWESSIAGQHFSGYIQQLGVFPFHVVFYTEQQLQLYVRACRTRNAVLHLDATGSVIANIPGQKRPLYYCLLLHDGSLPVMDILTTRHSGEWLQTLLINFNASVRLVNRGRLVTPKNIVIDFSFALIAACLRAFNGVAIRHYLDFTYRCISRRCTADKLKGWTFVILCMAHMLKTVSVRVYKVERRPQVRKLTMTAFAALQRTQDLDEARTLYRNVYVVLNNKREKEAVVAARQQILEAVSRTDTGSTEDIIAEEPSEEEMNQSIQNYTDVRTIRDRSPYTDIFRRAIEDVSIEEDESSPESTTYSPKCFNAIRNMIHLFPLWSATFQGNIERFHSDVTPQETDNAAQPVCQTNAAVESHFKTVKRSRHGGRLRLRPYQFVAAELQYVMGKVNKTQMPKLTSKRRKERKDISQKEEGWRAKRKPAKYADPVRAAKLMKSFTRSKQRLPHHLMRLELSDNAIQQVCTCKHFERKKA